MSGRTPAGGTPPGRSLSGRSLLTVLAWIPAIGALGGAAVTTAWGAQEQATLETLQEGRPDASQWVARLEAEKEAMETLRAEVASAGENDLTLTDRTSTYIVVSVGDRKLELHKRGAVPMAVSAGVGKGTTNIDGERWFFETPVGRFSVTAKEEAPEWNAPDWHYLEIASKGKLKKVEVKRSGSYPLEDGTAVVVVDDDVGVRAVDGTFTPFGIGDIVVGGTLFVPPSGTNQRKYPEILGTHRLKMQDGYAIHGTNREASVGRASSHGCVRLTNADIDKLHEEVDVGTPVFIF